MADRPDIEFLILADHAEVLNGKMYLMGGGWDRRTVGDFRQLQSFAVAVGVEIPQADANHPVHLSVVLVDSVGTAVAPPLQTQITVGRPLNARAGHHLRYLLAVNLQVVLPRPGDFAVEAQVGDGPVRRVNFAAEANPQVVPTSGTVLH